MPSLHHSSRHYTTASAAALLALVFATSPIFAAAPARLLAHWTFDEVAPPYASDGPYALALEQDSATTAAGTVPGVIGAATLVNWVEPGPATRLLNTASQIQRDSFGFSFWLNPSYLDAFNSLLGKEKSVQPSLQPWEKMAWQVQVGPNDGTGNAPLEFVVRGSGGGFYGNVFSGVKLALTQDTDRWIHVAGGYDAVTGALSLFVDGVAAYNISPFNAGAINSDGGALSVGTHKNGADVVGYGAGAAIDELQIYDSPLGADEVAFLRANPARTAATRPFPSLRAHWKFDELTAPFISAAPVVASLAHDVTTLPPGSESATLGGGRGVVLVADGGVPTRLHTTSTAVQLDSFSFAFWLRSDALASFDVLLTKEIPAYTVDPDYSRVAWRLQVSGDGEGDGTAPLELVVRGSARNGEPAPAPGAEPFFASVVSAQQLSLGTSTSWVHVAGGYDHVTGATSIYINGIASSAINTPGAISSDGSPLSIGSARNGATDVNGFSARATLDDLQFYEGLLASADVALLANNPGRTLAELLAFAIRDVQIDPLTGTSTLSFDSEDLMSYTVQASVDLVEWRPVTDIFGTGSTTSVTVARATLDEIFGPAPRSRVFFRISRP